MKVGQRYASHETVLNLFLRGYVPGETVSSLKFFNEQRNFTQNISVAGRTIRRDFACKEFGTKRAMKNSFVMFEREEVKNRSYK